MSVDANNNVAMIVSASSSQSVLCGESKMMPPAPMSSTAANDPPPPSEEGRRGRKRSSAHVWPNKPCAEQVAAKFQQLSAGESKPSPADMMGALIEGVRSCVIAYEVPQEMAGAQKPEPEAYFHLNTLRHLRPKDIADSLEASRSDLQWAFDRYYIQEMPRVERPIGISAFAINYLLSGAQRIHMMDILAQNYGGRNDFGKYDHLFWLRMLPDWALALFMREYSLTRAQATEVLTWQEEMLLAYYRPVDDVEPMAVDDVIP